MAKSAPFGGKQAPPFGKKADGSTVPNPGMSKAKLPMKKPFPDLENAADKKKKGDKKEDKKGG